MDIPATMPDPVQPWVPSVRNCHGHTRADVEAMVLRCVAAVRAGATVNPARCGTDAKTVLGLWSALGHPAPDELASDMELVAAWAQQSPDPAAARSIRAEGWAEGTDRSRMMDTLCRRAPWGDRLAAAQAWRAKGRGRLPAPGEGSMMDKLRAAMAAAASRVPDEELEVINAK